MIHTEHPNNICVYRKNMYAFLSRIFACEIDESILESLKTVCNMSMPQNKNLVSAYQMISDFLNSSEKDILIELAEDYARVFLGAGVSDGNAAFPYASVYTSEKKLVMQDIWKQISEVYEAKRIGLMNAPSEYMEDHISCELEYMSYLCESEAKENNSNSRAEQQEFLKKYVMSWITRFCQDIKKFAKTEFYQGMAMLLENYIHLDYQYLLNIGQEVVKAEISRGINKSYALSWKRWRDLFENLKKEYEIFAPKYSSGLQEEKTVRYGRVEKPEEIVWDKKSDFSPKEVYYPVSQTMLYFTEKEIYEDNNISEKGMLVFMRPCDIHAMSRLDRIFLENGGTEDYYYNRFRRKVKIVMLECTESFQDCFCVSMGSNKTEDYDMAIRIKKDCVKLHVKDTGLLPYFEKEAEAEFCPGYVQENHRKITIDRIDDAEFLHTVSELDYWKQYDENCIGCGGCNTVCGSCSCFDTIDITYNESGKEGERRRVWSSCMLEEYTMTAGGNRVRKTHGSNMRFKTFHKLYDYSLRFCVDEFMCVGCGRCIKKCPQGIDFFETIEGLNKEVKRLEKENEKGVKSKYAE